MSGYHSWPTGAWSHTQFETLRRCPRAHKLKYVQRLALIDRAAPALEIGKGFHRVLEIVGNAVLRDGREASTADVWENAVRVARDKATVPDVKLEITRLSAAYRAQWGGENAGYNGQELLGTEVLLLGGDLHREIGGFAAIADAIARDERGNIVYEHKTAGRLPSVPNGDEEALVREVKVGSQACALAYCYRETYGTIPTVVRNIITKTKIPGFKQIWMNFEANELDRWADEQHELEAMIPLNVCNRDACAPAMGFKCDYFHYCHGTNAERETLYQIRSAR